MPQQIELLPTEQPRGTHVTVGIGQIFGADGEVVLPTPEFVASVRTFGVLQPPVVVNAAPSGQYQIVDGRRRVYAAREAGITHLNVIAFPAGTSPRVAAAMALQMNLLREPNLLSEAANIAAMLNAGATEQQIMDRLGLSRADVLNRARLSSLHPRMREIVAQNLIAEGTVFWIADWPHDLQNFIVDIPRGRSGRITRAMCQEAAQQNNYQIPLPLPPEEDDVPYSAEWRARIDEHVRQNPVTFWSTLSPAARAAIAAVQAPPAPVVGIPDRSTMDRGANDDPTENQGQIIRATGRVTREAALEVGGVPYRYARSGGMNAEQIQQVRDAIERANAAPITLVREVVRHVTGTIAEARAVEDGNESWETVVELVAAAERAAPAESSDASDALFVQLGVVKRLAEALFNGEAAPVTPPAPAPVTAPPPNPAGARPRRTRIGGAMPGAVGATALRDTLRRATASPAPSPIVTLDQLAPRITPPDTPRVEELLREQARQINANGGGRAGRQRG